MTSQTSNKHRQLAIREKFHALRDKIASKLELIPENEALLAERLKVRQLIIKSSPCLTVIAQRNTTFSIDDQRNNGSLTSVATSFIDTNTHIPASTTTQCAVVIIS